MDKLPIELLDTILCLVADDALRQRTCKTFLNLILVNRRWNKVMLKSKNRKPFLVAHLNKTERHEDWFKFQATYKKTFSNPLFIMDAQWLVTLMESYIKYQHDDLEGELEDELSCTL